MASSPKLSVLVLNYNYARFLPECLDSILSQTYDNFELIVLDDKSPDNSVQVVEPYLKDPRVRLVVHEKNSGFRDSLIEGTEKLSTGDFLTVVSADDLVIRKDAFALQMDLLVRNPAATFCFSAFDFIRPDGSATHRSFPQDTVLGSGDALKEILMCRGVWPPHSGTIIRKSSYQQVGGYRRNVVMPLDLALWIDLSMVGGYAYSAESLHAWRLHGNQMTSSKTRANMKEIAEIVADGCRLGEQRGFGTQKLARKAVGDHLAAFAISEAFVGNRREALNRWYSAAIERPKEVLTSRRSWVVALRAALGATGFDVVRNAVRRVAPSAIRSAAE